MGLIKLEGKVIYEGPLAHVQFHSNWCDSMAEYYPYLGVYFFNESGERCWKRISSENMNYYNYTKCEIVVDEDQKDKHLKMVFREEAIDHSKRVHKGDIVRILRGRKHKHGIEGEVFWVGETKFGYGQRLGLILLNEERIFIDRKNVETLEYIRLIEEEQ